MLIILWHIEGVCRLYYDEESDRYSGTLWKDGVEVSGLWSAPVHVILRKYWARLTKEKPTFQIERHIHQLHRIRDGSRACKVIPCPSTLIVTMHFIGRVSDQSACLLRLHQSCKECSNLTSYSQGVVLHHASWFSVTMQLPRAPTLLDARWCIEARGTGEASQIVRFGITWSWIWWKSHWAC